MQNFITGLRKMDELYKSVTKKLDADVFKLLTLDNSKPGVTMPDASLLQYIPGGHQMKIWELVKNEKVLVIRVRVIHRILMRMGIITEPEKGIVSLPTRLRIPTQAEVDELIATAI